MNPSKSNAAGVASVLLLLVAALVGGCERSPGMNNNSGPDASLDLCDDRCGTGEVCVVWFDGTCTQSGPSCVTVDATCAGGGCSSTCEPVLCGAPYQCQLQIGCGTPIENRSGGVRCYGP